MESSPLISNMDREQKSSGKEMVGSSDEAVVRSAFTHSNDPQHAGSRLSQIHWDKDGLPFLELKDGAALTPFHKDDAESFVSPVSKPLTRPRGQLSQLDFERSRVPMAWEPPQE